MNCPGWPWHGSGPFPAGCYWCAKRRVLEGKPASDEVRRFVGFGIPSPAGGRWRPVAVDNVRASVLERPRRFVASDGFKALLRALAGRDG